MGFRTRITFYRATRKLFECTQIDSSHRDENFEPQLAYVWTPFAPPRSKKKKIHFATRGIIDNRCLIPYIPIEYHCNVHKSSFHKQTVILSPNFNMFHRILKKLASKAIVFYIVIYETCDHIGPLQVHLLSTYLALSYMKLLVLNP